MGQRLVLMAILMSLEFGLGVHAQAASVRVMELGLYLGHELGVEQMGNSSGTVTSRKLGSHALYGIVGAHYGTLLVGACVEWRNDIQFGSVSSGRISNASSGGTFFGLGVLKQWEKTFLLAGFAPFGSADFSTQNGYLFGSESAQSPKTLTFGSPRLIRLTGGFEVVPYIFLHASLVWNTLSSQSVDGSLSLPLGADSLHHYAVGSGVSIIY